MKITVAQKNMRKALGATERIVSRNLTLPILNNLLLKTENGRLRISATNLEIGIHYTIGAKIEEVGEIAVPGRILADFVNNTTEEALTLTTKNNSLLIQSKAYKTQILGFETKEFPIIPRIKEGAICEIPGRILKSALLTTADSIAASESRPELAGLFARFSDNKVTFAATDSFRLVERTLNIKSTKNTAIIIPRNTVMELLHGIQESDETIAVRASENQVSFSNEEFELVSRLIDGTYPDYAKVIPEKFISRALTVREELEKNSRLAGLFSSSIADIHLRCGDGKLELSAKNPDRGAIEVAVECILKNEPFDIALNYHYLLDGLKIMNSDKVLIEFTGVGSPLVLRPGDDRRDLVYLIMPLRR